MCSYSIDKVFSIFSHISTEQMIMYMEIDPEKGTSNVSSLFAYLEILHVFIYCLLGIFQNQLLMEKKKIFQEYHHQSVKQFGSSMGPDLGPNFCKGCQQMTLVGKE